MHFLMCPHCGHLFRHAEAAQNPFGPGLVPLHHTMLAGGAAVCPGTNQNPRNPESDRRPLWRDGDDREAIQPGDYRYYRGPGQGGPG